MAHKQIHVQKKKKYRHFVQYIQRHKKRNVGKNKKKIVQWMTCTTGNQTQDAITTYTDPSYTPYTLHT